MSSSEQLQTPPTNSFWNDTGRTGITSWIFSTDHKRIGFLYFYSVPASARTPASGVPVHSAVLTASLSQGWLTGRGSSRAATSTGLSKRRWPS